MIYSNSKRVDSERMASEILQLKDRILGYQESIKGLRIQGKTSDRENIKRAKPIRMQPAGNRIITDGYGQCGNQ